MPRFDDIRPYRDDEVPTVVRRLLRNQELRKTVVAFLFPHATRHWGWLLRPLAGVYLRWRFGRVRTVTDFQQRLGGYMKKLVARTITRLTVSGLDRLDPDQAYLFVSNHRDIVMDPALINWALVQQKRPTVQIAIGDNLLSKSFVSDLMRLNKSFIVKRSTPSRREKLAAAKQLSHYIHDTVNHGGESVWIAQREGRAKDGVDRTNSAVIGMLSLARPKGQLYAERIQELNLVPVAISYEYDPCDAMKARERYHQLEKGGYRKTQHEDVESIVLGMMGRKGRVHVAFGTPLQGDYQNDAEVAVAIDRQIHRLFHLFESHETAHRWLHEHLDMVSPPWVPKALRERVTGQPVELKHYILAQYANAVEAQENERD